MASTQREIPPGLADLLEGFVMTVIKEKPDDLMEFAARYFSSIQCRRNSLAEHGVKMETPAVDFYMTGSDWNGAI